MKDSSNLIGEIENELFKQNILENCSQIAKYSYDEFLSDGFFEEVPFISPFVKAGKLVLSIPDKLLMIKLIHFMDGLRKNNIPYNKRLEFYEQINSSSKKSQKVGFDLLNIIERSDELIKVKIIAEAFSWCLIARIDYSTFLRLSHGVNLSFSSDLLGLVQEENEAIRENLVISGFVTIRTGKTWEDVGTNYYDLNKLGELLIRIIKQVDNE